MGFCSSAGAWRGASCAIATGGVSVTDPSAGGGTAQGLRGSQSALSGGAARSAGSTTATSFVAAVGGITIDGGLGSDRIGGVLPLETSALDGTDSPAVTAAIAKNTNILCFTIAKLPPP